MIIKCEQCQTKFRLDDSKVTAKGVKVRCAKCKHVFAVRKEGGEEETQLPASVPEPASVAAQPDAPQEVTPSPESRPTPPSFAFEEELAAATAGAAAAAESESFGDLPSDFETGFAPAPVSQERPATFEEYEEQGFDFKEETAQVPAMQEDSAFSEFDFGDFASQAEAPLEERPVAVFEDDAVIPPAPSAEPVSPEPQGLDFSDDDMFGTVVPPATEEPGEAISFDFDTDSFADSMDTVATDAAPKESSISLETSGEVPFSLGEIDFGEELTAVAVQQVNPDELKPSQEILFAPLAQAQEKAAADEGLNKALPEEPAKADAEEELPPLPITSRRKQSPVFSSLIAAAALLVVGVLGYFGYNSFMPDKSAPQETGKITLRAVKASYVKNAAIGTLLVMSGEALNEYSKPRAALQVKGSVLGAAGQPLATKTAYCGNPLTAEQLVSLTQDKIEAAMANQFGDSLANLEVPAGKAVPFTIVIANPPADGKDFAVEPAGSTVASGKQ